MAGAGEVGGSQVGVEGQHPRPWQGRVGGKAAGSYFSLQI